MKSKTLTIVVISIVACFSMISCDYSTKDKNGVLLFENLIPTTEEKWEVVHSSLWIPIPKKVGPFMYYGNYRYSGPIAKYFENDTLEFKGYYSFGEKSGQWKYYYQDGRLKKEEAYLDSIFRGYQKKEYAKNGTLLSELLKKENDTLYYREHYKNGKLSYELKNKKSYKKFTPEGILYEYFDQDSIKIIKHKKTLKLIERGYFSNGEKTGLWEKYYFNGNKAYEKNYHNGYRKGAWKEYFESGKLKEKYFFNNDHRLEGHYSMHYDNGNPKTRGNYDEKGRKSGKWIEYNSEGKIRKSALYKLGELDGVYKDYYHDGKLKSKGKYYGGTKIGTWFYYYSDGSLKRKVKED
ncbi:MAG: toxin-antitoxin system YwqK family antitoxin [Flavobacteriaceae bacterium]